MHLSQRTSLHISSLTHAAARTLSSAPLFGVQIGGSQARETQVQFDNPWPLHDQRHSSSTSDCITMDNPPLASLSLTHVYYDPNDLISYICAYLALVPQGLVVVYAALIWSTREIEILLMFAGQMSCEALNWLLKRWFQEERPSRAYLLQSLRLELLYPG